MKGTSLSKVIPTGSLSVERARDILAKTRRVDEVKHVRDVAIAMAAYARAAKAGRAVAVDAAEIVLTADRRMGQLELETIQSTKGGRGKTVARCHGLGRDEAMRNRKVAALPAKDFDSYTKAARRAEQPVTVAGAVALSRLKAPERERVLTSLEDDPDVRKAIGKAKLATKRALAEEIRANPVITPDGRYQVIACDPPWAYGERQRKKSSDTAHRATSLYPEMSTEDICALPVASLAQESCVLFLWVTNAHMRNGYRAVEAWGFAPKTIITWNKVDLGMGDYVRNVTEHAILAVRGCPILSLTTQTTLITERRREHSRKPTAFFNLVESLCPGSKLEMFAREMRDGWTSWGAETGKFGGCRSVDVRPAGERTIGLFGAA